MRSQGRRLDKFTQPPTLRYGFCDKPQPNGILKRKIRLTYKCFFLEGPVGLGDEQMAVWRKSKHGGNMWKGGNKDVKGCSGWGTEGIPKVLQPCSQPSIISSQAMLLMGLPS